MVIVRAKDAAKMNKKDIEARLSELQFELIKASVTANKTTAKTKEIKRAISRLLTFNKSVKEELKQK